MKQLLMIPLYFLSMQSFAIAEIDLSPKTVPEQFQNVFIDSTIDFQFEASGGEAPYTYTIYSGDFPQFLTLDHKTGQVSGKATIKDDFTFGILVEDAEENLRSFRNYHISVIQQLTINLEGPCLYGSVGKHFSESLIITGGKHPYTLSLKGASLPNGLSLNETYTGEIDGTPTESGTFEVIIQVTDAVGNLAEKAFSISIFEPVSIITERLYDGFVGQSYAMPLSITGGSGIYSITISSLPAGLYFNQSSQMITGIPEKNTSSGPVFITASDHQGNDSPQKELPSFRISNPLKLSDLPDGHIGKEYHHYLPVSGGKNKINCSVKGNLGDISFHSDQCLFTGMPQEAAYLNVAITVSDQSYPCPQILNTRMNIIIHDKLSINNSSIVPTAIQGIEITPVQLDIQGYLGRVNCQVSNGQLPNGLTLTHKTISGTPLEAGSYMFEITVTDDKNQTTKGFYGYIRETLAFKTALLPEMIYEKPYNYGINVSGGTLPIRCNLNEGLLPEGINFDRNNCQFSGIVESHQDSFKMTVKAMDSGFPQQFIEKDFTIQTRNPGQLSIFPVKLEPVLAFREYKQFFTGSTDNIQAKWSIISAHVSGLSFDNSDGKFALKGIPDRPGNYSFRLKLDDHYNNFLPAEKNYSLTVIEPLIINTQSLNYARSGQSYHDVITIQGGVPPYTFHVTDGRLVEGVQLDSETGCLSGTVASTVEESTVFTLCVNSADCFSQTVCQSFPMIVFSGQDLDIRINNQKSAHQFESYTLILSGINGAKPYDWENATPLMPSGLVSNIQNNQFLITGQPTVCDPFQQFLIRVRLKDQLQSVASHAIGIDIECACDYELSGNLSELPNIDVALFKKELLEDQMIHQARTDESGHYSFHISDCDAYYIKPLASHFMFDPVQSPMITRQNCSNIDFDAQFIDDDPPEMFQAKALVIFGMSDQSPQVIKAIENEILTALMQNGFNDNNYLWINDQTEDLLTEIHMAMTSWASDACMLWVYLYGNITDDALSINKDKQLSVRELSNELNIYGQQSGKKIVIIAEGKPSASTFLSNVDISPNILNIRISAPFPENNDYWGLFSSVFWQSFSHKKNLADAYNYAQKLRENKDQFILDANADHIYSKDDLDIAKNIYFNGNVIDLPQIESHISSQVLSSNNIVHVWATVKPGTYGVNRVFVKQFKAPLPLNHPYVITDGNQIELIFNADNGQYEADIPFDKQGTSHLVFWASDTNDFYSNPRAITIKRNEIYKALIVSGRRAIEDHDNLKDAIQLNADFAYNSLEQMGFSQQDIVYLSAYETNKPYTRLTSKEIFKEILYKMADTSDRLLLYMIDHGEKDRFYLNNEHCVLTNTFNDWLMDVLPKLPKGMVLIYDACNSGDFVCQLQLDPNYPLIRMASTSPGENAVFYNDGTLSFSFNLWAHLCTGKFDIVEAFDNAKHFLEKTDSNQRPMLDLNNDNQWNQDDDLFGYTYIGKKEDFTVKSVSIEKSTHVSWMKDSGIMSISCELKKEYQDDIDNMFAIVYAPMGTRLIDRSPQIMLKQSDHLFQAIYPYAFEPGDYTINYFAGYKSGRNQFFDVQTIRQDLSLKKDNYEPDHYLSLAVSLDHLLLRSFHEPSDKDIMCFYAMENNTYTISVQRERTAPSIAFQLTSFNKTVKDKWMSDDHLQSEHIWQCPQSGLYYLTVMLDHTENEPGSGENYQIEIIFPKKTDAYENDNTFSNACPIDINDRPQFHTFHHESDIDWVKFFGMKGATYTVKCEPVIYDQRLIIKYANENNLDDIIDNRARANARFQGRDIECTETGLYYIRISPNINTWEDKDLFKYDLSLNMMEGPDFGTGHIQGHVYDYLSTDINLLSDVGIRFKGQKKYQISKNGMYAIRCNDKGIATLLARKNDYLLYTGEIKCPDVFKVKTHDIYLNHRLKSIIAILQVQAGMTSGLLPKNVSADKYLDINEVLWMMSENNDK